MADIIPTAEAISLIDPPSHRDCPAPPGPESALVTAVVQISSAARRALSTACCSSGLMTPDGSSRRDLITCSMVVMTAQP
jgi:hypothetical protein